jgi:hypothetical protein
MSVVRQVADGLIVGIKAEHEAAHRAAKTAIAHAMKAGALLLSAKDMVPYGEWRRWLADNFEFSAKTATGYMRLATLSPAKRQRVADLSLRQALAEIAEPMKRSTPAEPVRPAPEEHAVEAEDQNAGPVQVQVYACLRDAWDEADEATRRKFLLDDDVKAELLKLCRLRSPA